MSNLGFNMRAALSVGLLLSVSLTGCGGGSTSSLPQSVTPAAQAPAATMEHAVQSNARKTAVRPADINNAYSAAVLADSPLAYYQLDDGSSTLVDSGPYSIGGTYGTSITHGVQPITQASTGASGFPGGTTYDPNAFAYTPPNAVLQPATVTIEAWIKCNAANTTTRDIPIAVYGTEKSGVRYGLYFHGLGSSVNSLLFVEQNAGQTNKLRLYGSTRLGIGNVYHVVAVSDGTHVTTYVNGLLDQTAAYPGSIDYSAPVANGIQIGGDSLNATYGSAPFPGTIAQVAVYGTALPMARIVSHYLAGQLRPMTTETATQADSFVDTIGINTHFENYNTPYSIQFPQVKTLLVASGIRHIRVGMSFNNTGYLAQMQQLAAAGIRGSYTVDSSITQSQVQSFPSLVYPSLEQYEPPNEQDDQGGHPDWIPGCIAFQQNLYAWVKGSQQTARYPVLGPALAWPSSYQKLGDLSSYMDNGNIHDYMANYNPGNPYAVWGGIKFVVNASKATSGTKPIDATETGYGTIVGNPATLDYRTDLRYMTRLFFEQYLAGIQRSYSYEFIDQGGIAGFDNYGILQNDLTPKPAYTGIKSLIGALQDPGAGFTTSALTYNISGFTNNVHHLLMQKRNGSFVLALWIEVPGWNVSVGGDIIVPTQSVTLTTTNAFSSASLSTMDENGNFSNAPLSWNYGQSTFSLSDKVSLVTLTP